VAIAVPSRLKSRVSQDQPLAGLRIAVKDIFEIKGVRISVCNKGYYELYPPPQKTAASIDLLCCAGAKIIGTTKLASFAATEEPVECIDYQAPWNPRGDGYQSPAGSSSGSAAAIASYDWLDISIGSDSKCYLLSMINKPFESLFIYR
jgi:Asp-tRNA(Asn)/Glu-tRNA(Gln) amidotransferase A subunit family amidase